MISVPLIVVATALIACAIVAKVFADEPEKPGKSQKAEIIKQLLVLSERENKIPAAASSVRLRAPLSNQGIRPSNGPRRTTTKTSQPIRSNK